MKNTGQISISDLLPKPKEVKDTSIPVGVHLKSKEIWCPYCSMPVIFLKDKQTGTKKCPNCNISDRDFWVNKVNFKR